jgi:ABC-type dipeptide/oligopeptide/nickel transport system permease component
MITFLLPSFFHSTIARQVLGPKAPLVLVKKFNHRYGFDQPIWVQYFRYMKNLLHGNLGTSFGADQFGESVTHLIGAAVWRSMWLALISLLLALLLLLLLRFLLLVRLLMIMIIFMIMLLLLLSAMTAIEQHKGPKEKFVGDGLQAGKGFELDKMAT